MQRAALDIHRSILRIAIPSIFANITIPLVGLVDMVIVGHISTAWAIGGIAVGTMLFDMLYGCFGFLRVSTSGLTAQAYGRHDWQECASLLVRGARPALAGAVGIWLLQWLYIRVALQLIPCSEEVALFAQQYFNIRIWAAPATLMLMVLKGWLIGMQDGTRAMVSDMVVNGVNMLASYLLAVHTPLGAIGVAWGTLIAQWTGLVVTLLMAYKVLYRLRIDWRGIFRYKREEKKIVRLNIDLFVRSLCFIIVYVGWTAVSSAYGDEELAASSLLMKLFMLFSFFIDGFAYAGEAIVGKYIGAGRRSELSTPIRALMLWAMGIVVVFSSVYAIWSSSIYGLMTSDAAVIATMEHYTGWLIAMPIVSMLAFMWDGIYAGATLGKEIRNAMLLAAGSFAIVYIVLRPYMGMQAVYAAYFAHLAARVLYLTAIAGRVYKGANIQEAHSEQAEG